MGEGSLGSELGLWVLGVSIEGLTLKFPAVPREFRNADYLQEPGRDFAGMVPGLHSKLATWVGMSSAATKAAFPVSLGVSVIVLPCAAAGKSAAADDVTVMTPLR